MTPMVRPAANREALAVKVHNLHKAYRRGNLVAPVLRGVDLEIEPGRCVFLAGPSGSGKSTLLSILGCILSPDQGEVRICGQDLAALDDAGRIALRRHRIGFVFQRFHLIRGLSAWQNVAVPLVLRGEPSRQARRRALEMLDAVGLAQQAVAHPHQLSAGQCQRVALARALVGDPDLILPGSDGPAAPPGPPTGKDGHRGNPRPADFPLRGPCVLAGKRPPGRSLSRCCRPLLNGGGWPCSAF